MNSKKNKHKNRPNKAPNPIPPQSIEQIQDKADVILEDVKQSTPKDEERVPEIISEVMPPTADVESKLEEQPKKPKRNRGKKNQQEEVSSEIKTDDPKLKLEQKEGKNVDENIQEAILSGPEITPSARKKKNKNKKESENESLDFKNAEKALIEEKKTEPIVNADDNTIAISEELPEEAKHKKKNKKKKNRNDSEKSDKAEQVSCIAAFQKLMKDEKLDDKINKKNTVDQETPKIIATKANPVTEPISQESSVVKVKDNTMVLFEKSSEELCKSKKKNKKNPPLEEDNKLDKQTEEMVTKDSKNDIELQEQPIAVKNAQKLVKDEVILGGTLIKDVIKSDNIIASEENKKSNVKIVKPINKKRKDKMSDQKRDQEENSEVQAKFLPLEDKPHNVVVEQHLISASEQVIVLDDKLCSQTNPELENLITLVSSDSENVQLQGTTLDVAPTSQMETKGIEPPEPLKSDQHIKSDLKSNKNKIDEETSEDIQATDNIKLDLDVLKIEIKPETDIVRKYEEKRVKEKTFEKQLNKEAEKEQVEGGNKNLEGKAKKKRKKSPKPLVDVKSISESEKITSTSETSSANDDNSTRKDTDVQTPHYQLLADEIEIRSLQADESEGSTCGFTPDLVQYPRATSQDLMDNNNNMMVIQEVLMADIDKLNVPFNLPDTPLITGSGEVPTTLSEKIVIDKGPTEEKYKPHDSCAVEKTDVKSKMMEVNRDMEDLRLSIEKSLAELTAIEMSEQKLDKDFDAQKSQSTNETKVTYNTPSELLTQPMFDFKNVESSSENVVEVTNPTEIAETEVLEKSQEFTSHEVLIENKNPIKMTNIEEAADNTLTGKNTESSNQTDNKKLSEASVKETSPPICPTRKDQKNKGKNKKKGKHERSSAVVQCESSSAVIPTEIKMEEKEPKTEEKPKAESKTIQEIGKQQNSMYSDENNELEPKNDTSQMVKDFEPIENFEDAMTSSADDINKSFEIIANETNQSVESSHVNPEINITAPVEDTRGKRKKDDKINPVSQPKNLLGHPDIPAPSNRIDYKKEKNKTPNEIVANVKIKDAISIEAKRESKESQTDNIKKFMKNKSIDESFSVVTNENDDFVYKYSFRKVFLQSACHICKKELKQSRVPCSYCNLVFYCSAKHKDEDWSQHQAFCFAVSTIVHLKEQKHIYADAKDIKGQNYRLLRMQMIVSCEKVLKRKLAPWEQEALLYPRICAEPSCREWRQSKLVDCDGCGQISFCADHPDHFPKLHQRWCNSYSLYQKLVCYQQTKGRLEPKMPSKVMVDYEIPEKMNEVLASMYEVKIDMNDMQYAALTQIATAPLTAAYAYQTFTKQSSLPNGVYKKNTLTIHVVGAELQFEADALDKWEVFFLHAVGARRLRLVLVARDLNPSRLPLDLLANIKVCDNCRLNDRHVTFSFQDKMTYHEYCTSDDFIPANLVCAFNTNISRSSTYNEMDPWPKTINCILKNRAPFLVTASTINDIHRDFCRIKSCAQYNYNVVIQPKTNGFASVRPDRNFLSDDEIPLLFKNNCFTLIHGAP